MHLDFNNYEYTVHIQELRLVEVIPGPVTQYGFSGGTFSIYADGSFNAPFRFWTDPNQVPALDPTRVPSTFTDGRLLARFRCQSYISLYWQSAGIGTIAYSATALQLKGGPVRRTFRALNMLSGWHMGGGFTDDEDAYIPDGYGSRYDALTQWEGPLPVDASTWGGIKAIYR